MNSLALWAMLALPSGAPAEPTPTPQPGSVESSKIRLDAYDVSGALADAELVIAEGGGADAFAARADAHRAQGAPFEEVLADYAQAAKLDPRYIEKYNGLIAQRESERNPKRIKGGTGLNGVPVSFIAVIAAASALCIAGAFLLARGRGGVSSATDDEAGAKDQDSPVKKPEDGSAS